MWNGVNISVLSGCKYVRGLLFRTASISVITVVISSKLSLESFKAFFKHLFVLRINLSKSPPHGALAKLKCHEIPLVEENYLISFDLKVLVLSEIIMAGVPLRAINRFIQLKNEAVSRLLHSSRCIILREVQVIRAI